MDNVKEDTLQSLKDYRNNWREFTAFGIVYIFISAYIFIPILSSILHRILVYVSGGVVVNQGAFSLLNLIVISKRYYQDRKRMIGWGELRLPEKNLPLLKSTEKRLQDLMKRRKITALIMIIILIIATFGLGTVVQENLVYAGRNVEIVSHRGIVDGEFENSLSAVRASLEANIDAVGMDVQTTKDEVIVLNHDRTLNRTFSLPYDIRNTDYKELMNQEVSLPEGFLPGDPYLPTLDEVLTLIDGQLDIHIDVKTFGESELYAEQIVEVVEENDMVEYAYIQSFDYEFLQKVRVLNPEIQTAQILYFAIGNIASLDVDYLTVYKGMLNNELVQKVNRAEKGLFVWTVNSEDAIREVLQYDIKGIITDYPLRVQEIMGRGRY